jgi:acetyltransferase-like isoleucine patch superfamily enzyme
MMTIISRFIQLIGKGSALLFPKSFCSITQKLLTHFYTGFYSQRFAQWGHSTITYPALELNGLQYISVGDATVFGKNLQLCAWDSFLNQRFQPHITIGNNCHIRANSHISAINSITIGDHLLTGTNVLITDNSHGEASHEQMDIPPTQRPLFSKGPVKIGNNVWLGNNVCVMPGVTIGDGAIIGANAVVTHDIPAYSVAVGIPARVIKQR